jgi:hypothetical protein
MVSGGCAGLCHAIEPRFNEAAFKRHVTGDSMEIIAVWIEDEGCASRRSTRTDVEKRCGSNTGWL